MWLALEIEGGILSTSMLPCPWFTVMNEDVESRVICPTGRLTREYSLILGGFDVRELVSILTRIDRGRCSPSTEHTHAR